MSTDIVESLPARKHAPVAAPVAKAKGKKGGGGGSPEENSEKRIRQAVYDIRYRARREDIDLKSAYSQYMSNSNLSQAERSAVREKLFGKEGGGVKEQFTTGADDWATSNLANALYKVFAEQEDAEMELAYLQQLDEEDSKKYKVRVTDKTGKSYVRFATREKITQLRGNPNIKSVEMTEHGEPYEGERRRGEQTAKAKRGLDPVGKEDADVDNDGDVDKSDKYLLKRRKAIGASIRKRADQKIKEAFLADGTVTTEPKNKTKVTGKDVDNYTSGAVKVSPADSEKDNTPKGKGGIYASFAHQKFSEIISEKAATKKAAEEVDESMINTANCEKKPESKEKDMRGYYAKINTIKNKIRAMGAKNPIVMADPDEVEKSWDKDKKKDDDLDESLKGKIAKTVFKGVAKGVKKIVKGKLPKKAAYGKAQQGSFLTRQKDKLAKQTGYNPGKDYGASYGKSKSELDSLRNPMRSTYDYPDGLPAKKPYVKKVNEDKTTVAPTHKPGEKNSQYNEDGTKKVKKEVEPGKNPDGSRYNPFTKDGKTKKGDRTPTSASQTTGP